MDTRFCLTGGTPARGLRPRRAALLPVALLGLVLVTACGSTPKVLGVSVGAGSPEDFAAYLQCMRAHGVPIVSKPATSEQQHTSVQASGSLDPSTPAFKAADSACRPLNPVANLSPTQRAQLKAANLA